jgi:Cu-processing system permease protein
MKNIQTIAINTFKEVIRDKILYSILGFSFLFILLTVFLGSISLGEDIKIIRDFGLAGIYLFSLIIAMFIGTSLVYKELEKRTLYITLSKPVSKKQFIVGKFLGLFSGILVTMAFMAVVYLIVVLAKGGGFDWRGLTAIGLSLAEIGIFVSLCILFSTFSKPLASTIYAVLVLYIGHSLNMLLSHFEKIGGIGEHIFRAFYHILPNLEKFNLRNIVVHDTAINATEIAYAVAYSIIYITLLLVLSVWSLRKQEL